jgi:excisionase family DNA binding protein
MALANVLPAAFTVSSAVSYSGLSRSKLYELMKAGAIASFHVGGRRMILREALDTFFARLSAAA